MPQAIDIQSREICLIIPDPVELSGHIQACSKQAANDIPLLQISRTAVIRIFSSYMRIKLNEPDFERMRDIIIRIKTHGLLVKCLGIILIGQIRERVDAFGIKTCFADLLIIKGVGDLRITVDSLYLRINAAGVDVESQCAMRNGACQ